MKKAFNFRSAIVCVLVLIMCLMAFVACDKDKDGGQTDNGLVKARDYVKQLYINDNKETAADYTVVSKVNIGGVVYSVSWTVEIKTEGASVDDVKVVPGTDSFTIDVIDMAESSIDYTLTATVTDANGNTETVSFERTVPKFKVSTWAEYAEAPDGKLLIVDGVVTIVNSKTNGSTYNSMYIQDEDGAYYAYSMKEDPADKNIAVGMTVRLTGTKKNYNGTYELENVLIKEVLSTEIKTIEPTDITEVFKGAESTKANVLTNMQGRFVTIKNAIAVEVDSNQKYCYFTVDGLKTYIRPSASAGFLDDAQIKTFMSDFTKNLGHVVEVTGQALVYNGAFYMQPTTADAVKYGDVADLNPAAQVKFVKDNANALANVTYSGYSVELPSASDIFSDVKIAWSVDNKDVCTIADGKATFTYDYATEGRKVKLTATYTHATDTTVAPLTNEYELELLIPQDVTVKEFLEKDEDSKVYIITGYVVADGSSSGTGSFVVADATGAVFSYNKADVTLGEKVKVYGTRTSNSGVDQIGTLNVVKVDDGTTYTYPEAKVVDGTTLDLSTLSKTSIGEWTGVYTEITGLTFYKNGSYNSAGLLNEGATAGSTNKDDYTQVLSLYSASDAIPEEWAGKPVNVYGYVRGFSTNKYLTIQVAKVEIGYSDAQKVAFAKEALTTAEIGGTEFDKDFVLPLEGVYGTTISWAVKGESSYVAINGANVTVTKPETERENVTIVATIRSGEVTDTKEFEIAILGATPSYAVNWTDTALTAVYGEGGTALVNGGEVEKGTVVTFTVAVPANKVVKSVSVNGAEDTSVAYKTTFTVTVNAATTVVVNYNDVTTVTVAQFLEKSVDANTLYAITGYIGAYGGTADAEGSFVLIDETGAAFSYNKITGYAVGDYVTVYGTRADNYKFPQLGTKHVVKLEGGTYVEPATTQINASEVKTDGSDFYTGKLYEIVGGKLAIDGTYYNVNNADGTRVISIYFSDDMKDAVLALDGKDVIIKGYSRGVNTRNAYWQVQVLSIVELSDDVKVEQAKEALALENTTLGTGTLTLPATGINGTTIAWASDNAAIAIAEDGVTATIVAGESDILVNLTAIITLGEASVTKVIPVTVTAKTPEYTVTFVEEADNGTMIEVAVDGTSIATGAKVEQGKTLTITVVIGDANYALVAVKANSTALVEVEEGVYTYQVAGDVEITVEVKESLNTPEKIVNAAYALAKDTSLEGTYTLTGKIISVDTAYSTQFKNVTVTIVVGDMTDKPVQCFRMKGTDAEKLAANDTITVTGTLKNYGGTIEFDANCSLDARVVGTSTISVSEESSANATVTITDGLTSGENGTAFTFTVAVASGHELVSVKVNNNVVVAAEGQYTCTINGNMVIVVETKEEGAVVAASEALAIAGSTGTLDSKTITWDSATSFTVIGRQASSTSPIRTQDSDHFRVYNGSELEITGKGDKKITKVVITCLNASYATALSGSLKTTGATAAVSGSIVTVTVTEGTVDSVLFTATVQTRISNVEVYTL